jgi:hypothetical protein
MMQINTCLWGGMYNPIIPFFRQIPSWWARDKRRFETARQILAGYFDFFEPDFIVEAEQGLTGGLGFNSERILQLDDVLTRSDDRDRNGYGLSVLDLYRDLYRKEFQFARRHDHDIVDVTPEDPLFETFGACIFGAFPKEESLNYLGQAFAKAFEPKKVGLNGVQLARLFETGFTSALDIGRSNIEVDYHDHSDPTLFVLDAHRSRDLLDFWNLRAVRRNVVPIPAQWLGEISHFCKRFITENHRPLPGNPHGVMIHVTVMFARSIATDEMERLHRDHLRVDVAEANVLQKWYPPFWRASPQYTIREMRPTLSGAEKTFDVSVTEDEPTLRFDCLHPEFASEYGNRNRWANVVRLRDWTFKDQIATAFPSDYRNPKLPRFRMSGEHLLPTTEGFVIFPRYRNLPERWKLLDGTTAINEWFKVSGVEATLSDAGRATQQIIQTLGGFWGVRCLSNPDVIRLLDEISRRPVTRSIQYQDFRNRIQTATKGDIWSSRTFESLVERRAVELGLEVKCTKCSSWSWYSLKELDYQLSCNLCLRQFGFPIVTPSAGTNTKWAYRLIGPFALPKFANGGYATALSVRFFSDVIGKHDRADITWSAGQELELTNGKKVEADYILWYQRKVSFGNDHSTDVVFGEAKSFGNDVFKGADFERMKRLALRFPGAILVFSTMRSAAELSKDEIGRIARLAEWGREPVKDRRQTRAPVILLTGAELFASFSLYEAWNKLGGRHAQLIQPGWVREDDLRTLANLTQQLYLDMPSHETWLEAKWKKRSARRKERLDAVVAAGG